MASTSVQCPLACTAWTNYTTCKHTMPAVNKSVLVASVSTLESHRETHVHGLNRHPSDGEDIWPTGPRRSKPLSSRPPARTPAPVVGSKPCIPVCYICTPPLARSRVLSGRLPSRRNRRDHSEGTCVGALPGHALVIGCWRLLLASRDNSDHPRVSHASQKQKRHHLDRGQAPFAQRDNPNVCCTAERWLWSSVS